VVCEGTIRGFSLRNHLKQDTRLAHHQGAPVRKGGSGDALTIQFCSVSGAQIDRFGALAVPADFTVVCNGCTSLLNTLKSSSVAGLHPSWLCKT
jgi:hypothetical protein